MKRAEDLPLEKVTLNLYEGDYARLRELHGHRPGAGKIIRTLVRSHIRRAEEAAQQKIRPTNFDVNVKIPEDVGLKTEIL